MMCISRKVLLDLLEKFPDIKDYFMDRARKRRLEFRRVSSID